MNNWQIAVLVCAKGGLAITSVAPFAALAGALPYWNPFTFVVGVASRLAVGVGLGMIKRQIMGQLSDILPRVAAEAALKAVGSLKVEVTGADAAARRLHNIGRGLEAAQARAINDTLAWLRTRVSAAIREKFAIKKADLDTHLKPTWATAARLEGKLVGQSEPIPALAFGGRQIKRGVSVKIRAGGARTILQGAFIAAMASGHRGVFRRRNRRRLPIVEQKIISVGPMMRQAIGGKTGSLEYGLVREAESYLRKRLAYHVGRLVASGK